MNVSILRESYTARLLIFFSLNAAIALNVLTKCRLVCVQVGITHGNID